MPNRVTVALNQSGVVVRHNQMTSFKHCWLKCIQLLLRTETSAHNRETSAWCRTRTLTSVISASGDCKYQAPPNDALRHRERERQRGRDSSPLISGQILFLHVSTQTVRAKPTHSRNRSRREERAKNLRRRQRDASEA